MTLCLILCPGGAALAQGSAPVTYESCRVCHADVGSAGTIPAIRGRPYQDLMTEMTGLAAGAGTATIMHRFMVALTPAEIEDLARHLSALEAPAR